MSKLIDQEIMAKLLFEKYGKVALSDDEAAQALGCSVKTLSKDRGNANGIPFTRRNNTQKGQIMYSVTAIAKVLVENESKVI